MTVTLGVCLRAIRYVLMFCVSAFFLGCDAEPDRPLAEFAQELEQSLERKRQDEVEKRDRIVELTEYLWESRGYETLEANCAAENYSSISDEILRWRRSGCRGDHPLHFSFVPYPRREGMSSHAIARRVRFCLFSQTAGKGVPIDSMFGPPSVDVQRHLQTTLAVRAVHRVLYVYSFNQFDGLGLFGKWSVKVQRGQNRYDAVVLARDWLKPLKRSNSYEFICGRE